MKVDTAEQFEHDLKNLAKRYRSVRQDVEAFAARLRDGEMPGVRVPGIKGYVVYKARIKSSDLQKGKSGGYRIIYYLRTEKAVRLLTIYPKVSVGDIRPERIVDLINAQIDP